MQTGNITTSSVLINLLINMQIASESRTEPLKMRLAKGTEGEREREKERGRESVEGKCPAASSETVDQH